LNWLSKSGLVLIGQDPRVRRGERSRPWTDTDVEFYPNAGVRGAMMEGREGQEQQLKPASEAGFALAWLNQKE